MAARAERPEVVLVVEDENEVRRMICLVLEREGYRVLDATDGREALQLITEARATVDLIITDIVMPWMGGEELMEELRAAGHRTPIIYTSGFVRRAEELSEHTPDALLVKPFTPRHLLTVVDKVLRGRAEPRPD